MRIGDKPDNMAAGGSGGGDRPPGEAGPSGHGQGADRVIIRKRRAKASKLIPDPEHPGEVTTVNAFRVRERKIRERKIKENQQFFNAVSVQDEATILENLNGLVRDGLVRNRQPFTDLCEARDFIEKFEHNRENPQSVFKGTFEGMELSASQVLDFLIARKNFNAKDE